MVVVTITNSGCLPESAGVGTRNKL